MRLSTGDAEVDIDYVDNGQHWCRLCNVFPETVEKMLDHFHSKAHRDQVENLEIDDKPWHKRNSIQAAKPGLSAKKLPFRGMQFFSPVEGWYCRLCNTWMGDHHCATSHLKSVEHNSNYMTFLDEHPDWEPKWNHDREKASLKNVDVKIEPRKSRFHERPSVDDNSEKSQSIRVQMRNTIKMDENRTSSEFVNKSDSKDAGLDEWMGKNQKVPLDIIDTQKFAEIVRQKHGNNLIKEDEKPSIAFVQDHAKPPSSSQQPLHRESDRDRRDDSSNNADRRRHERVEMQISSRENRDRDTRDKNDRDRRDLRGSGGGRRRSRSRSRSRDRGYNSRRRSRSRSRDRDRRDRDRTTRDKSDIVKKLPIIGKMPLYKRPTAGKEKDTKSDETSINTGDNSSKSAMFGHQEESNMSGYSENSMTGTNMQQQGHQISTAGSAFEVIHTTFPVSVSTGESFVGTEPASTVVPDSDLKPPGEKEAPGGTNLPDDLQQALDIIYKGGGKPITIPPPSIHSSIPIGVPPPISHPPPSTSYSHSHSDYSSTSYPGSGSGYMGYEPYQMSFDGYGPPPGYDDNMEEVTVPGNVPVPSEVKADEPTVESIPPRPTASLDTDNVDDDMDDLRMLGIDLDDVAVVVKK